MIEVLKLIFDTPEKLTRGIFNCIKFVFTIIFAISRWGLHVRGGKGINAYGQQKQSEQAAHYQRAWVYLKQIAKKKTLSAMDTAYSKTENK